MTNSRASGGAMTLIEKFISGSALATKTFTFSAINWTTTSHLILIINGEPTAAFDLYARLNSVALSTHNCDGCLMSAGVTGSSAALARVAVSGQAIVANKSFHTEIHIFVNPIGQKFGTYHAMTTGDTIGEVWTGSNQTDSSTFTTIIIETSTSTWKTGTTMELYRVNK